MKPKNSSRYYGCGKEVRLSYLGVIPTIKLQISVDQNFYESAENHMNVNFHDKNLHFFMIIVTPPKIHVAQPTILTRGIGL